MGRTTVDDIVEWERKGKVKKLVRALRDEDIQTAAAESLARIGEPAVVPLISCLKDESVNVQAAMALGNMGGPAVRPLVECLKDEYAGAYAVNALAQIGEIAVMPLIRCLTDEGALTYAALALEKIGEPAIEPLIHCLKDETLGAHATSLLANIGEPCVEPLVSQLVLISYQQNKNETMLVNAEKILKVIGGEKAMGAMRRLGMIQAEGETEAMTGVDPEALVEIEEKLDDLERILDELEEEAVTGAEERDMQRDATAGVDLDALLDRFVDELASIGTGVGFLGEGEGFGSNGKNKRAVEIGEKVNDMGGIELMRKVADRVLAMPGLSRNSASARELEVAWGYIGEWLP